MKNSFLALLLILFTSSMSFSSSTCSDYFQFTVVEDLAENGNDAYYQALVHKYRQPAKGMQIVLSDKNVATPENARVVTPTATASTTQMREVPVTEYQQLVEQSAQLIPLAKEVRFMSAKMQAGTGSSVSRKNFLAGLRGQKTDDVKLGAKGTDLTIPRTEEGEPLPIAQEQILQMAQASNRFKSVEWLDLVNDETFGSISNLWREPSVLKALSQYPRFHRGETLLQMNRPSMDSEGKPSNNRMAPAGHGLFSDIVLRKIFRQSTAENKDRILALSNGEDLSGTPDPLILAYMKKNRIPILMITTDKTEIDLKGGQIALAEESGKPYVTIVEYAQAERAGQKELFEKLGLRVGDRKAMFNTNMVLFNFEILGPMLQKAAKELGLSEEQFFSLISPDLVENPKKQVDKDGVERKYTQLEGTLGSMVLNLDKLFRTRLGRSVLGFVNIDRQTRTRFFAPVKTAFDYYMQFYSDRFKYDTKNRRLVDQNPGHLPTIKLTDAQTGDKYYSDVSNVLHAFEGSSILQLEKLELEGPVVLNGITLKGQVKIVNKSGAEVHLKKYLEAHPQIGLKQGQGWILENVEIQL